MNKADMAGASKLHKVPYALSVFGKEEIAAVNEVLKTPMIGPREKTYEFEEKISHLFAKKYGVMMTSCSSANLLALELLNLPVGSEIITPVVTFGTTLSPIYQKGLVPAFCDVEEGSWLIDVSQIESMICNKTKAIMVPSLFGNIPDYEVLAKIAQKNKLWLIEDSADTVGAKIRGVPTGKYTDISTTSFYASHVITTGGHGGMICFNDEEWHGRAKTLIGWGRSSAKNETEDYNYRFNITVDGIPYDAKFVFEELGYNFQTSDIDAAFGLAQFSKLKQNAEARIKNFDNLTNFFKKYEEFFILPKQRADVETMWLAFPLVIRDDAPFSRREFAIFLEQNGIQTRPLFTGNALRQPAFKNLEAHRRPEYPVADLVMRGSVVIGVHHGLTNDQIEFVMKKSDEFMKPYLNNS
jgi:CDP-6-deoxy-D-xylo-4-hexulose-3-dehydrase